MTADEAGQSWLVRTGEIIDEWKAAGSDQTQLAQVHMEGTRASAGISALFENRGSELSQPMIDNLNKAVDILAKINSDSLDASFESPWKSAASGFGQDLGQEVSAGWTAVKEKAAAAAKSLNLDLTMIAIAAVAIGLLFILVNAKAQKALA